MPIRRRPDHSNRRRPPLGGVATAAHLGCAAVCAGLALLVWHLQSGYRGWEAWTAAHATSLFVSAPVGSSRANAAFYLGIPSPHAFGLDVTGECTSATVTGLVLAATGVLAAVTRLRLRRLALAALAAASLFYLLNLARLVLVALATEKWGLDTGYHWSHRWAGTFITVLGGVGVCALYLLLLVGARRRDRVGDGAPR